MDKQIEEHDDWRFYDHSSLPILIKHDTWDVRTGLSLVCGIDPKYSEFFDPHKYFKTDHIEKWMFDESRPFWRVRLLNDDKERQIPRCWFADQKDEINAMLEWEKWSNDSDKTSFSKLVGCQYEASAKFVAAWELFFSNQDHQREKAWVPAYFLQWAVDKGFFPDWLEWALERDQIPSGFENKAGGIQELDKRERDTLDSLIGALLHALEIDPGQRGVIKKIEGFTEDYGAPIRKTALSKILHRIPKSKESVQDRKGR